MDVRVSSAFDEDFSSSASSTLKFVRLFFIFYRIYCIGFYR